MRSTTSSPAATGGGPGGMSAGGPPARRSPSWVSATFTAKTVDGVTRLRPVGRRPMSAPATEPSAHVPLLDAGPVLDVVIPVHNEEAALAASVDAGAPPPEPVALLLPDHDRRQREHRRHRVRGAPPLARVRRGAGGLPAREGPWPRAEAGLVDVGRRVLVYMDVDLSTDLNALLPLVAPLLSGHSDLAIGSRLTRGSRTPARPEAGGHLTLLQPAAARHAARGVLRRAVRLQGDPRRSGARAAAAGRGR